MLQRAEWMDDGDAAFVGDVMRTPVVTLAPSMQVAEALKIAEACAVHYLPVMNWGLVVGVVCRCDLAARAGGTTVSRCISKTPVVVNLDAPLPRAARLIRHHHVGCLPVVRARRLVGIITRGDLRRIGVLVGDDRKPCKACGSRRHVRDFGGMIFCRDCMDNVRGSDFAELYVDIGGGD